jgi:riboflavin synthase
MFTGIVRAVGKVEDVRRTGAGARLVVSAGRVAAEISAGDSVSVSGACLTVASAGRDGVEFDVVGETLARTTLGEWEQGRRVNLEPALKVGDPLGGHFVTGHVDGVSVCRAFRRTGEGAEASFELERALLADAVEKGSVALDGVSLTVAGLEPGGFRVALVPYTLSETTLGELRPGVKVNVETDLLVKAVRRALKGLGGGPGGLTEGFLREHGFV